MTTCARKWAPNATDAGVCVCVCVCVCALITLVNPLNPNNPIHSNKHNNPTHTKPQPLLSNRSEEDRAKLQELMDKGEAEFR